MNKFGLMLCTVLILSASLTGCAENKIAPNKPNSVTLPSNPITNNSTNKDLSNAKNDMPAYYDYKGTIGQSKIEMEIYKNQNNIMGTYLYDDVGKEIMLKGTWKNQTLKLTEFDNSSKTGNIQAKENDKDQFIGTWSNSDNTKTYPLALNLIQVIYADYGHKYRAAGIDNDKEVEQFAQTIQDDVKVNDKNSLATRIHFPINCTIDGKKMEIDNYQEFIKYYDKILNPNFKNVLSAASTKFMFGNSQGVMFGGNMYNVWINNVMNTPYPLKLYITAINN